MAKKPKNRKPRKASVGRDRAKTKKRSEKALKASKATLVTNSAIAYAGHYHAERFPIVGLGASAGGLDAFTSFLKALAPDTGMGFVLIQHLDPTHESLLASLLQRSTKMPVREASDGTVVEPNHAYIIPPNSRMTISNGVLSLTSLEPGSLRDYPIDQFFVSLAEDLKHRAIGVVLSGTASDGTRGLLAIKGEGGITFAQDAESAKFSGMPVSAIAAGGVDFTLRPDQIAKELSRINGHPYIHRAPSTEPPLPPATDGLRKILRQLRVVTGVDFGLYKPAMIARRVARRMALHKLKSYDRYLELIQKDRTELNALYEDIFIHVTGFFRDPESLQALQRRVLVNLVPGKASRTIRIWVPGCSSGEEVYSIAMLLFETLGERRNEVAIHVFGTDISERSVQKARAGIYPAPSMVDVSTERQRRFFSRLDGSFQITKAIRDVCVFARHDLGKDPPFSRMDLISCRNVLIYMGAVLQKKVIEAFHYALKPGGHLLLGKSESLSAYASLFGTDDSKHKILVRRALASPLNVHTETAESAEDERVPVAPRVAPQISDMRREAERLLLDRFTPPALVVDSNLQIVHFQGNTGPFLSPSAGEPSFHLLRMIKPELLADMRTAIYQAKKEDGAVKKGGIRFKHDGEQSIVDILVSPMKARHTKDRDYLVIFRENAAPAPSKTEPSPTLRERAKGVLARKDREIASLRAQLQDLVQDHEAADEEVRSMNEEILSSNEELQSTNEELETAKEELESTNEELITLNDELQKRNTDLSQTTDDLSNVLVAIDIPIVLLDSDHRIRRFTPVAGQVLNLINADVGRPLSDIVSTLPTVNWKEMTARVLETGQPSEIEVRDRDGHWYALRLRPYRSSTDRVDGTLIALLDVDMVKRTMEQAETARRLAQDLQAKLALAAEGLPIGMWEFDIASGEVRGNKQWSALYGIPADRALSRPEWLARVHPEDRAAVQEDLDENIARGKISSLQYRVVWPDGSIHWLDRRAEAVCDERGNPTKLRVVSMDISEQKKVEEETRAVSARIASAQELERQRIARELHDNLVQELAGISMELSRRAAETPASSNQPDFKALQNRVVRAAEAARNVAYELHPTEVDDLGLERVLRAYCHQFALESGMAVEFRIRKVPSDLSREIASCLYRVALEGLRNIAKHAAARKAKVFLDVRDKHIRLRVEDDGKGFLLSALASAEGLGVASMRERVQLVNGNFTIVSQPGKGTTVMAQIPLAGKGK